MHTLALIEFFCLDTLEGYYASGKLILCVCSHRDRGFTYVWGGWGSLARGHNMHMLIPGNNQLCMGTCNSRTLLSKIIGNHLQPHQVVSGTGTGPYGIKSDLATNRESPPANPISYVKYAKI